MFVTFEGIEGSGKSTLVSALAKELRKNGKTVLTTREPGGTRAGDAIRAIFLQPDMELHPMTEALLVNASRAALVQEVIRPALERGEIVLCDRYTDSTLAYQGYGRGLDLAVLRTLCNAATEALEPDLTFLLDIAIELSESRRKGRGNGSDRLENEARAFHVRVRDGFLALAKEERRIHVLDGTKSPDELVRIACSLM